MSGDNVAILAIVSGAIAVLVVIVARMIWAAIKTSKDKWD